MRALCCVIRGAIETLEVPVRQVPGPQSRWQEMTEDERDAVILQRVAETAAKYLPFEEQYEELFGEKLELPTDLETSEERR